MKKHKINKLYKISITEKQIIIGWNDGEKNSMGRIKIIRKADFILPLQIHDKAQVA